MSTGHVVAAAVAAFLGSLWPGAWPLWLVVAVGAAALVVRRPVATVVAVAALCSLLAARSWAGLEPGPPGQVEGAGSVVTDPVRLGPGTRAVVRIDGRRYLATGYGGAGARLSRLEAGDTIVIAGRSSPYTGPDERRAALHVGERLALDAVVGTPATGPVWRVANGVRLLVREGAADLDNERRALFTGIVFGDDRGQDPVTEVDFRLAGLTHLLAVSGQNVAYLLTVCRPVFERVSLRARWPLTVVVLVVFATVTRFEPSVLRATMMAGLAVTARTVGREADSARLLALAVVVLLVIDPLLAETVAFRLSVAASAGIVALSPAIARMTPGPRWIRESLAVTVAAQLAVAPVLMTTFGPVSVVSIPANVAAGPVAGFLMGWGMSAGIVAGLIPALADPIHRVTAAGLSVLEGIAAGAAAVPLAPVGLVWVGLAAVVVMTRSWWRVSIPTVVAALLAVGVLVAGLVPRTPAGSHRVGYDSRLLVDHQGTTLVLGDERSTTALLEDLYRLGVRHVDRAFVEPAQAPTALTLQERIEIDTVIESTDG